jgi:selenocysteine lyase/cysteine desulfurase
MTFRITHTAIATKLLRVVLFALCLVVFSSNVLSQGKPVKTEMQQPNLDGLVEVSFKIDAAGKIQIVHINSTSPQLTEYVVNKLSKIKLSNDTAPDGKVITYRFVFKKQA